MAADQLADAIRTSQADLLDIANRLGLSASRVAELEAGAGSADNGAPGRYWPVQRYSQLDPRWRSMLYSGLGNPDGTFGKNGCLVTAFCMLKNFLFNTPPYTVMNPLEWSKVLNRACCFRENYLSYPSRLAVKFPELADGLTWKQGHRWPGAADIDFVKAQLQRGPLVVGIDFKSNTAAIEPHWVLALGYVEPSEPGGSDDSLIFADPWGGMIRTLDHYWNRTWRPNPTLVSRVLMAAWEFEPRAE
jgi:hypothetical protein